MGLSTEEPKVCPIISGGSVNEKGEVQLVACQEAGCQFWHSRLGDCAMVVYSKDNQDNAEAEEIQFLPENESVQQDYGEE